MAEWLPSGSSCPICEKETQIKTETRDDGLKYETGERCTKCRWVIDFEKEDEVRAQEY